MSNLNISANTPVLVMLCDDACSPCYTFESDGRKQARLSEEDLRDILSWAMNPEPTASETLFLVGGDEPLDPSVGSVLEDMADKAVTLLLPVDKQESLDIPFARNQTVVARSLMDIVDHVDQIEGRPVIVHIERQEIDRLAESLLAIQDSVGTIRLGDDAGKLTRSTDVKLLEAWPPGAQAGPDWACTKQSRRNNSGGPDPDAR